jgi:hypothetical protein
MRKQSAFRVSQPRVQRCGDGTYLCPDCTAKQSPVPRAATAVTRPSLESFTPVDPYTASARAATAITVAPPLARLTRSRLSEAELSRFAPPDPYTKKKETR